MLGAGVIGLSAALRISSVRSLPVQHSNAVARTVSDMLGIESWRP